MSAGARPRPESVDPQVEVDADPVEIARSIALGQLTAAPRTRAQLADVMRKRGVPVEAATEVLDRFDEVGLIDDAAFAQAWVSSRQAGRGLAPRALAGELRRRGVPEPLIADAVDTLDPDAVESAARTLVTRRLRAMTGLAPEVQLRRLVAMLARKGYSGDLALRVARDAVRATPADPDTADLDAADLDAADSV